MTDTRPLALVTGASSGIGYELARQFAGNCYDVLICAEDAAIDTAAQSLTTPTSSLRSIRANLPPEEGVERGVTEEWSAGRLEAVALNAGVGNAGSFVLTPLEDDLRLIELTIMSAVYLAKQLLPKLVQQGSGKVLFTSSVAATMPGPYYATYAASKASGVSVTALQPGPTDTEFFERQAWRTPPSGRAARTTPPTWPSRASRH